MKHGLLAAAAAISVLSSVAALAQETAAQVAPASDPASLKAAAEAIDPLAQAAEAEAAWQAYLEALEGAGGSAGEQAFALNRVGDSRYYQQNMQGALASALEAMKRLESAGVDDGEAMAETLANAAVFYGATGQPERQLPMQERSLAIRTGLYGTDPSGLEPAAAKALGMGYLNYSHALYEAGRFSEGADLVEPSITGLIEGGVTDATLFVAFSSGANMLADAGRMVEALDMAQRGVAKANALLPKGHPFMGFAQATLAKVLLKADRYEEAEEPARKALDIMAEKLGPSNPNSLVALHNMGVINARLGHYDEAITLMLASAAELQKSDPGEVVNTYLSASNAAHEAGRDTQALDLAQQAAAAATALDETDGKAIGGFLTLADRQEEAGDYAAALTALAQASERLARTGNEPVPADIAIQQGLLEIRAGRADEGWARVAEARERLTAAMVADARSFELGTDLESYYESIMRLAEAAIATNRADDALRAFELASWGANARARQYLTLKSDLSSDAGAAAAVDVLDAGNARLRVLSRERASLLLAQRNDEAEARAQEIARVEAEVEAAREALTAARPDFADWLAPDAVTVESLQARLSAEEALLIAMPSRHRMFSMVVTSDAVAMAEIAGGRPVVRPLVARMRDTLDGAAALGREFDAEAAHGLHDLIMPLAVRRALHGKSRVAVVTSDALSRIPFGILLASRPEDGSDYAAMNWAVRHHAFSTALTPSSAFSGYDGEADIESFLGIGAPAQGEEAESDSPAYRGALYSGADLASLPALPGAAAEIVAVAKASRASQTRVLSGAEASERLVRQESRHPADIVLFATHGLVAGEIGGLREPALILSRPAQVEDADDDGFLLASEIAALDFGSDLVILSACNSAAGRNETAPAYTGLANAFLSAGSRNLMLSHWRVRDDAAATLTAGTVEAAAAGKDFASALQKAQLRMLNETKDRAAFAHPAFWAPYIVIGD